MPEITDGGPWKGPTEEEWIERITRLSLNDGESLPWIKSVDRHLVRKDEPSELEKLADWGDR